MRQRLLTDSLERTKVDKAANNGDNRWVRGATFVPLPDNGPNLPGRSPANYRSKKAIKPKGPYLSHLQTPIKAFFLTFCSSLFALPLFIWVEVEGCTETPVLLKPRLTSGFLVLAKPVGRGTNQTRLQQRQSGHWQDFFDEKSFCLIYGAHAAPIPHFRL